jgi:predicted ATP-binding protein involved in virulence
MKINELSIEGFRGFKDKVEFKLDPQVNVFLGVNGAGKTTVLDALGGVLDKVLQLSIEEEFEVDIKKVIIDENLSFSQFDINTTKIEAFISAKAYGKPNDINYNLNINREGNFFSRSNDESIFLDTPYSEFILYINNNKKAQYNANKKGTIKSLVQRFYEESIGSKDDYFKLFSEWFIHEAQFENQTKINKKDFNFKNPILESFRTILEEFIETIDGGKNYKIYLDFIEEKNVPLDFSIRSRKEVLFVKKGHNKFRFDKLSEGEKSILLLIGEIIRHIIFFSNKESYQDIINTPGIILIDEIEQHLHPKWQRNIIPALTKVFPNIQWFITTHSPQVLSNLKRENIHLIEDFKVVKDVPPTFGEDTNSILWNVFGVGKRPLHAEKAFSKFYRMLEKDGTKSLKVLEELEEAYSKEHSDVKKARLEYEYEYGKYSA